MTETSDHPPAGCAVRNPSLQIPRHEYVVKRRKELSAILHVVHVSDGYCVLQIPGEDGAPFTPWAGSFESRAAASFFLDDLLNAAIDGKPEAACCSFGIYEHFNLAGRILNIIEAHEGGARDLARKIASEEPWKCKPEAAYDAEDIPFFVGAAQVPCRADLRHPDPARPVPPDQAGRAQGDAAA
ncbi:hypothetical protein [Paracoccus sp. S-4012]|uniref:hypothetical protein n=1 Tax=Paracoccus sp. S-4012 TaxID=2665648 RepID=UPI0018A22205|nr:hypothetical protein [Paracoccus sp. S-4012]